jgi:hypothetical protein
MGKKFSCIKNLSTTSSQDCITGLSLIGKTMKIQFTAIKSKV